MKARQNKTDEKKSKYFHTSLTLQLNFCRGGIELSISVISLTSHHAFLPASATRNHDRKYNACRESKPAIKESTICFTNPYPTFALLVACSTFKA